MPVIDKAMAEGLERVSQSNLNQPQLSEFSPQEIAEAEQFFNVPWWKFILNLIRPASNGNHDHSQTNHR